MKLVQPISLAACAALLVSCFGKREETVFAIEPAPAAPKATPAAPRSDRPPPPPQPQDGSLIVTPGGTVARSSAPDVSDKQKDDALAAAQREVIRRKQDSAEADDLVSKALKNVDEEDLNKAFSELKKAVEKYPATGE